MQVACQRWIAAGKTALRCAITAWFQNCRITSQRRRELLQESHHPLMAIHAVPRFRWKSVLHLVHIHSTTEMESVKRGRSLPRSEGSRRQGNLRRSAVDTSKAVPARADRKMSLQSIDSPSICRSRDSGLDAPSNQTPVESRNGFCQYFCLPMIHPISDFLAVVQDQQPCHQDGAHVYETQATDRIVGR